MALSSCISSLPSISLSSSTFCSISTDWGPCPNFLALTISTCSRIGDSGSSSVPGSNRNCCVSTGLRFAPSQRVISRIYIPLSCKKFQLHKCSVFLNKWRFALSYIHVVITARNQGIHLCLAHTLSIALGILNILQVVLNKSKFQLRLTLLSCSGVDIAISCSFVPALASSHLIAIIALTNKKDMSWAASDNSVKNNSQETHTNTKFSHLGYQNVCARQWQGCSPESIKSSSRPGILRPLAMILILSSLDSSRPFH